MEDGAEKISRFYIGYKETLLLEMVLRRIIKDIFVVRFRKIPGDCKKHDCKFPY